MKVQLTGRFKNWHPCQFLNLEFLLCKNSVVLLYTAIRGGNDAVKKLNTLFFIFK